MEKIMTLMGAKSQIEALQRLVKCYETKAEKALTPTAASRNWGLAAQYSGRIGELRRWVAERELRILERKEALSC